MSTYYLSSLSAQLDEFVDGYIEAALWSSTDDNGEPLDKNYDRSGIAECSLASMRRDCLQFFGKHMDKFEHVGREHTAAEMAGHNFWLNRNGHGAGFWDGDYPEHGDELDKASHEFGESSLYVGDNGKIYVYPE